MDIISIKLTTGEETIGRLKETTDDSIVLTKPMSFTVGQQGIGLGPFMFSLGRNTADVSVNKNNIIAMVKTDDLIAKEYIKQTSGLVV